MKINRQNAGWIFLSVIGFILLGLSIYLGLSGWYLQGDQNGTTSLRLGKSTTIEVQENKANSFSLVMEGSYLPDQKIPQIISVKNVSEGDVFVRARAVVDSSLAGEMALEVETNSNWFMADDGYYYYLQPLVSQNKVIWSSNIIFPNQNQHSSKEDYIATFIFETLGKDQTIDEIWKNNPLIK